MVSYVAAHVGQILIPDASTELQLWQRTLGGSLAQNTAMLYTFPELSEFFFISRSIESSKRILKEEQQG